MAIFFRPQVASFSLTTSPIPLEKARRSAGRAQKRVCLSGALPQFERHDSRLTNHSQGRALIKQNPQLHGFALGPTKQIASQGHDIWEFGAIQPTDQVPSLEPHCGRRAVGIDTLNDKPSSPHRSHFETGPCGQVLVVEKVRLVDEAHAIQAGREIRVILNAKKADDTQAFQIAEAIARRVEAEMTFPGEIKVTVLREVRAEAIAR